MSRVITAFGLIFLGSCSSPPGEILVYTRTAGFRHDSIPAAVDALASLASQDGFRIEHSEDPTVFTPARLSRHPAVVFLHTSGDMLDGDGVDALLAYVRGGGGFLGIHAASDALYGSAPYHELVGATFNGHPPMQSATLVVEDTANAATASLPVRWQHVDEFYEFTSNPRGSVHVLVRVDESTYVGGGMGADHPLSWCHSFGNGRSFYTALGHPIEAWSDPVFLSHVRGGLRIAAGLTAANCARN